MALSDAVAYFTQQTHILASMAIACGTTDIVHTALGGCLTEAGDPVLPDTVYDLASLTKLYTCLLVYRLHEEGLLDLSAPVTAYAPQFTRLAGCTVDQLLGFEVGLVTPERVDAQPDAAAGLRVLQAIHPVDVGEGRAYSDMHAMVLRYVLEGAADLSYMELLHSRILQPLSLADTTARPDPLRCPSYAGEHRL